MPLPIAAYVGISLGGMLLQALGGKQAGDAAAKAGRQQRRVAESQADLADFNANVADIQADDALTRGQQEEQRFRSLVKGTIGSQRVGFAAGNIDVGFGSAVDVQADAAMLGELDALNIRVNAKREAWGYKVQAEDLRTRGKIARKEGVYLEAAGRANQTAQRWQTASSLVNTGASLLSTKYGFGGGGGGGGSWRGVPYK